MSFQSRRLQFNQFAPDDFPDYYTLVASAKVMQHVTGKGLNETEARIRFNQVLKTNEKEVEKGVYKVLLREEQVFVGLAKLVADRPGSAEIGYLLKPSFWGQKLGAEIAQAMIDKGKSLDDITQLTAITAPENTGSNKILRQLNFILKEKGLYRGVPALFYQRSLDNTQR